MNKERRNMDHALKDIYKSKSFPKSAYFLFILIYFISLYCTTSAAKSSNSFNLFNVSVPFMVLTGVFSSVSNVCVILLVVYYKKVGYITGMIICIMQLPMMCVHFFVQHNPNAIPGLFSGLFIIFSISMVFIYNLKMNSYQEKIRNQALLDTLTGLPNRFACGEILKRFIRRGVKFTLVSIDLNNFKSINDSMGHKVGNEVLVEISKRWKEVADNWKSGTVDFIGRLGGDEFILVIREYENQEQVLKTIEYYRNELEKVIHINDNEYYITACFGYSEYPTDADNDISLVSYADAAMHEVKKKRNNAVSILRFTHDLTEADQSLEIERIIRNAIETGDLFYNLQPQFDMDHKLRGFEVLARMVDGEGKPVSPGVFIPVAENTGIIDKVDLYVFKNAAIFFGKLIGKTSDKITLSINISVKHLMKNDFIEEIKGVLEESKVPADQLEIEITESIMIESADKALDRIKELKKMGIKVAIDDFGTGYSSLSYLNTLPSDLLKIDKSFIDELTAEKSSKNYVAAIVSLGHSLNLEVISEGVETEEQLEALKSVGCDYIQGFIWGKPLAPQEAAEFVS
ncbi:MAG: bifunctional diguanylate cyclase/phosphodiesterase [Lachnospiraceae bacterium]|nr:bifunctional diguanylate cyclase/phosphodiesterase [Lachnospiraceae bacterium]